MPLIHRIARKRKWLILILPIVAGSAAYFFTAASGPAFSARALVRITTSVTLSELLTDVVSYSSYDRMATQAILIESHTVLENAARRLNLVQGDEVSESVYQDLRERVSAEQESTSNLLAIRGAADSEDAAISLTNAVVDAYVEMQKNDSSQNRQRALDLIRSRMEEAQTAVAEAERAQLQFRRTHGATLASSPGVLVELRDREETYEERLNGLRSSLETVARVRANRDYASLVGSYLPIDDGIARSMADETHRLSQTLADQIAQRDEFLRVQTDTSPSVVALSASIEGVERRLGSQLNALEGRLRDAIRDTERRLSDTLSRAAVARRQPDLAGQLDEITLDVRRKQEALMRLREEFRNQEIQQGEAPEEVTVVESARAASRTATPAAVYSGIAGVLGGFFAGLALALMLKPPGSHESGVRPSKAAAEELRDIMALTNDKP